MAKYVVSLDNEERNIYADNLSITGRVNGRQSAVVIKLSSVIHLSKAEAKLFKQKALVSAFLKRQEALVSEEGERIEV